MVDTAGFIPSYLEKGINQAPSYANTKQLDTSPPVLDGKAMQLYGQGRDWYFRASKLNPEEYEYRLFYLDRALRLVQRKSLRDVRETLKEHLPSLATGEYLDGDAEVGTLLCKADHGLVEYAQSKCLDGLVWYTSIYRDSTPLCDNQDNGQGNLEQELEREISVSEVLAEGFGTSMGYLQNCALTVDERQEVKDVMYQARTLYNLVLRRELRAFDRLVMLNPQRRITHDQPQYGILRILLEVEGHRLSRPQSIPGQKYPLLRMPRVTELILDGRAHVTEAELELALPPGADGDLVFKPEFERVARFLARYDPTTLRYCMRRGYQASPDVFRLSATNFTKINWELLRTIVFQRGHPDDLDFEPEAKDQHGVDVNVLRSAEFLKLEDMAQGDERKLEVVKRIQLLNSQWGHAVWAYNPLNHTTEPMEVDTEDEDG